MICWTYVKTFKKFTFKLNSVHKIYSNAYIINLKFGLAKPRKTKNQIPQLPMAKTNDTHINIERLDKVIRIEMLKESSRQNSSASRKFSTGKHLKVRPNLLNLQSHLIFITVNI